MSELIAMCVLEEERIKVEKPEVAYVTAATNFDKNKCKSVGEKGGSNKVQKSSIGIHKINNKPRSTFVIRTTLSGFCPKFKEWLVKKVAYRLLTRSTNTYTAGTAATLRRPYATEVSADTAPGDSAFSEAWKKVAPTIDPPKILIQFMEPRPPTPSSLPAKLTVNFVLPYSSELSKKEVDMVIVPATTGQMGILPGHVPMSFVSLFRFRLISNLLITDLFRAAAVSRAFIPGVLKEISNTYGVTTLENQAINVTFQVFPRLGKVVPLYPEIYKGYRFSAPSHSIRIVDTKLVEFIENINISGNGLLIDFDLQKSNEETPIIQMHVTINTSLGDSNQNILSHDNTHLSTDAYEISQHDLFRRLTMKCKKLSSPYDDLNDQENDVWELVKLPNRCKLVGCKWVFKTKLDPNGNIERHKPGLLAKGYIEKEGIDYQETFSSMSRKDSLRIMMALAAQFGISMKHVDLNLAKQ
ncbi:hypothetical protein LXL04_021320 [Taraxacum kok-saghyz]